MIPEPLAGIEALRQAVNLFSNCTESFNERWTPAELLALFEAYARSDWDIPPDQWTEEEIADALTGDAAVATGARGERTRGGDLVLSARAVVTSDSYHDEPPFYTICVDGGEATSFPGSTFLPGRADLHPHVFRTERAALAAWRAHGEAFLRDYRPPAEVQR